MGVFNYSQGQPHPTPPPHLKRVGRYDFGENVFGESRTAIEGFLRKESKFEGPSEPSLGKQIRRYIYNAANRKKYVAAATTYLKSKRPRLDETYDVVIVGAGVHAGSFLYALKKRTPEVKALIVERSPEICSTFYRLGDSLILNSPTFSRVGLNSNIIQGHFIQVSDFDELIDKPFPTAKHIYELATMVLFHADADILFNFEVKDVGKLRDGYAVCSGSKTAKSRTVIISNGMGEPKETSFLRDRHSERTISGDRFISDCYADSTFVERLRNKRVAVVGAGDTANCVMEYLLPLTYPNHHYSFYREAPLLPKSIHWIGQSAQNIKEYFFANKFRYCHSGGIIEFFWDGDTPFELSTDLWRKTKALVKYVPHKLVSLTHKTHSLELMTSDERMEVDLVVDCTGRANKLSSSLLQDGYELIEGSIVLYGGHWDESLDRFVALPRVLESSKIACKVRGESIFLLGSACPLRELIDDEEARNGSLEYQEHRTSLTNSKWSLEHTLPRTVAFAEVYAASFLL